MQIKLLAIDIDETLIRPTAKELSSENFDAIKRAQEQGVLVTLATGRIYTTAKNWVELLGIEIPVIACNGADVRLHHKTIFSDSLDMETVRGVVDTGAAHDMQKYIFSGDYVCCTPRERDDELFSKWFDNLTTMETLIMRESFEELYALAEGNVQKVLLWAKDSKQHKATMEALSVFLPKCNVVSGETLNIEITKRGTSKGLALKSIADSLGIAMDEIMAIGDNENDLSMLTAVGRGVAMENAAPKVKERMECHTASCDENGVARAIEKYILNA